LTCRRRQQNERKIQELLPLIDLGKFDMQAEAADWAENPEIVAY
jgi:hypothetical protein